MTDSEPDSALKLIETIYRAALDPQGYDTFMGHWNDWMVARMSALDTLRNSDAAMSDPEIATHFELALRLIERLGDTPQAPVRRGPQLLIDGQGRVLWKNAEADRLLGADRGTSMTDLALSDTHRALLESFLEGITTGTESPPVVVQITPAKSTRAVAFRAEPMRDGPDGNLAILSSLAPAWPEAADTLLEDTHRLSVGECAICALLVQGLPPTEIADRRGTSIATVRTQIKKILKKTQQASQAELTAYLNSLLRMAEELPRREEAPALQAIHSGAMHDLVVGGRRLIVEEHGPPKGYPVIFLHGMLDGTGITSPARQLLFDYNLRLICPHRPAFGRSEPMDCPPALALDHFADVLVELAELWDITAPVMLGHMAGALYGYAAAPKLGACGIVNVSGGVPLVSHHQLESMTRRQRLVAYTARYAPSVLPFVVNAGIRQIKGGGMETFMNSLYESAPVDMDVLQNDAVRALVLNGYQFTVHQGHAGFAVDSHHVVRDWTKWFAESAPIPVHLIHGAHDPVVSPASVQEFAARHAPRVQLDMLQDAGQLLFYKDPDLVLSVVRRMANAAQPAKQQNLTHG